MTAQSTLCPEPEYDPVNCPDPISWCSPQTTTYTMPVTGCTMNVIWQIRCNCPGVHAMRLIGIELLTPGCSSVSLNNLIDFALTTLAETNPMGFLQPPGTTTTIISTATSCWSRGWDLRFPNEIALPCDVASCCIREYTVVVDRDGNRTVTFTNGGGDICPPDAIDQYGRPCAAWCF
jgi:hypothetical protein